jgi:hypothetical protein
MICQQYCFFEGFRAMESDLGSDFEVKVLIVFVEFLTFNKGEYMQKKME